MAPPTKRKIKVVNTPGTLTGPENPDPRAGKRVLRSSVAAPASSEASRSSRGPDTDDRSSPSGEDAATPAPAPAPASAHDAEDSRSDAGELPEAEFDRPEGEYPPEDNDFDGRNIYQVMVRLRYHAPSWFIHEDFEVVKRTADRQYLSLEENAQFLQGQCYGQLCAAFQVAAAKNSQEKVAVYCHFNSISEFKSYLHTKVADSVGRMWLWVKRQAGKKRMKGFQDRTFFENIASLDKVAAPVRALIRSTQVPVRGLTGDDSLDQQVSMQTLFAALFRLMERDPARFDERPGNAPDGSVFSMGHSIEDWYRAYLLYQHFNRTRNNSKKKYNWAEKQKSAATLRDSLTWAMTADAARRRFDDAVQQDATLLRARTDESLALAGLDAPPIVHEVAFYSALQSVSADDIEPLPTRAPVLWTGHINIVSAVLLSANLEPLVEIPTYPPLTEDDLSTLSTMFPEVASRSLRPAPVTQRLGHVRGAGGLGASALAMLFGFDEGTEEGAQQLRVTTRSLPARGDTNARALAALQAHLVPPTDKPTEDSEHARLVLETAAVSDDALRLLAAGPHNAGISWALSRPGSPPMPKMADRALSWLYGTTTPDPRVVLPLSRTAMLRYLTARGPLLSALLADLRVSKAAESGGDKGGRPDGRRVLVLVPNMIAQCIVANCLALLEVETWSLPPQSVEGHDYREIATAAVDGFTPVGPGLRVLLGTAESFSEVNPDGRIVVDEVVHIGYPGVGSSPSLRHVVPMLEFRGEHADITLYTSPGTIHDTQWRHANLKIAACLAPGRDANNFPGLIMPSEVSAAVLGRDYEPLLSALVAIPAGCHSDAFIGALSTVLRWLVERWDVVQEVEGADKVTTHQAIAWALDTAQWLGWGSFPAGPDKTADSALTAKQCAGVVTAGANKVALLSESPPPWLRQQLLQTKEGQLVINPVSMAQLSGPGLPSIPELSDRTKATLQGIFKDPSSDEACRVVRVMAGDYQRKFAVPVKEEDTDELPPLADMNAEEEDLEEDSDEDMEGAE